MKGYAIQALKSGNFYNAEGLWNTSSAKLFPTLEKAQQFAVRRGFTSYLPNGRGDHVILKVEIIGTQLFPRSGLIGFGKAFRNSAVKEIDALQKNHFAWAKEVFPDETIGAKFDHFHKEVEEAELEPEKIEEFADCYLFLSYIARHYGYSMSQVVEAAEKKFEVCKTRKWAKTKQGFYQHVK